VSEELWTLAMEKQVGDRLQTIMREPLLASVWEAFGGEVFRRSSVFHGLGKFLADNEVRGKLCFEVGTWNGLTAIVLSRFFDRVVTVDIAHNRIKHDVIDHLGLKNIRCFDIKDNFDKARIAEQFPFDFAYLDGNHANDTGNDWALTRGCGRVLFHECWPIQPPVWDLVNSLPQTQVKYGGHGLALWQRKGITFS
jgi:hypothetical protein